MFSKVMLAFLMLDELCLLEVGVAEEGPAVKDCGGRMEGSVASVGRCRIVSLYVGWGRICTSPGVW